MPHAAQTGAYHDTALLSRVSATLPASRAEGDLRTQCPVCSSPRLASGGTVLTFSYARCRACGFTFVNPIPHAASTAFYNTPFYANYRVLEAERAGVDPYFSISAYAPVPEIAAWLGGDTGKRVLDFGCGPGAFLAYLRDVGGFADVTGLEINRESVTVARERYALDLACRTEELDPSGYDAVTLLEVIEHLPDPASVIAEIAQLIRPGGQLLITTPSVGNLVARFAPGQCVDFTPPSHISLFTRRALEALLAQHGFHTVRFRHDQGWRPLWHLAVAALYRLDFLSPQHCQDLDDRYFTPTRLGRALGAKPCRPQELRPAGLLSLVARVDRLAAKAATRVRWLPTSHHLYLLAQRDA